MPHTTSLIGGIKDSRGRQTKRVTLPSTSAWVLLPPILGETEVWAILNETASQVLYVAIDPPGDPNTIGATFADYFTLTGMGGGRDNWIEQTKPESIWVKAGAVNQVVAQVQWAKEMEQFRPKGDTPGQPGRVW